MLTDIQFALRLSDSFRLTAFLLRRCLQMRHWRRGTWKLRKSPLDDLLVKANLAPQDHQKIQAMLNAKTRSVSFKKGLHQQQKQWGSLHEVGHEFLPWQRELLYACPLLLLPRGVQEQFEAEADIFAAESFFFGENFHKQAFSGELSLTTAIELATEVYQTSLHATFAHYVEETPEPRCPTHLEAQGKERVIPKC